MTPSFVSFSPLFWTVSSPGYCPIPECFFSFRLRNSHSRCPSIDIFRVVVRSSFLFSRTRPIMIPSCMTHALPSSERYQAEDFHKFTNKRVSSPLSPGFQNTGGLPAEQPTTRRFFASGDKRPIASGRSPPSDPPRRLCGRIRKSSYSSVKEEDGGKLMYNLRCQ